MSISREERLGRLESFVSDSRKTLSSLVTQLGWSIESVTKNVVNMVVCPFDAAHRIPGTSLEKHLEACMWRAEGYGKEDVPLSIPSLSPENPSCIQFDEQLQDDVIQRAKQLNSSMKLGGGERLISRTSNKLFADFTSDERCAIYEYVIAHTVSPDMGEDIADLNKTKAPSDGQSTSYLELLAQERNLKRRRAKYRGVHTNKKSQVEILREVITQQMEMFAEYMSAQNGDMPKPTTDNSSNDVSKEQNLPTNREIHSRSSERRPRSKEKLQSDKSNKNIDKNERHYQSRSPRMSESKYYYKESSKDRGHHRKRDEKRSYSKEHRHKDRNHRDSRDKISHKSSQKRHRHGSKDRHEDRHKRRRSNDRKHNRKRSRDR